LNRLGRLFFVNLTPKTTDTKENMIFFEPKYQWQEYLNERGDRWRRTHDDPDVLAASKGAIQHTTH
jgi:hypothetical protein